LSIFSGFSPLTIPDAIRIPFVPSSIAIFTSSLLVIPAPHNAITFGFIFLRISTVAVIISGWAVLTDIPEPINSGGSVAQQSGYKAATAPAIFGGLAQTQVKRPNSFAKFRISSISESLILFSL